MVFGGLLTMLSLEPVRSTRMVLMLLVPPIDVKLDELVVVDRVREMAWLSSFWLNRDSFDE